MEKQKVLDRIKSSMMVLVGIGTEISEKHHTREELLAFYQEIAGAVKGKFYFVVTLNTDDLIYEAGFDPSLIVAPCGSDRTGNVITNGHYDESGYLPQWKAYQTWLGNTLNRELVILELGVGFEYPSVLRFPDEKMAFFNQKSTLVRIHSEFPQIPKEIREKNGITEATLRMSVGIEDAKDLIDELEKVFRETEQELYGGKKS